MLSTPAEVSTATDKASLIDEPVEEDTLLLIYSRLPARPTALTDELDIAEHLIKYIEYGVAARCLLVDSAIMSVEKAGHYKTRFDLGIQATRSVHNRILDASTGQPTKSGRPAHPRLPDHFPKVNYHGN